MVFRKIKRANFRKKRTARRMYRPTGRRVTKPKVDRVVTKNFKFIGYTQFTANQDCLIGNTKSLGISNNICFRPSLIPGTLNYSKVYSFFRFDSITVRFIPMCATLQVDDTDSGTSASTISKTTPRFYLTRVYGNEPVTDLTYETENSALIDGAKSCQMTKNMSIKFVPNSLRPSQIQRATGNNQPATTGWDVTKKGWHSCNDMETIFYGLKYYVSNTLSDNGEFLYKCLITAKLSWKGSNDANYTSEFGTTATVVSPIPSTS